MDILMSIGPLLISLGAFYVSILAYRRSGQREAIELHETTLALALSLEMTLKTSYANLLTRRIQGRGRGCNHKGSSDHARESRQ